MFADVSDRETQTFDRDAAPCPSAECDCPDCRAAFDQPRCLWCREAVPVDRQSDYCSTQCAIEAEGM